MFVNPSQIKNSLENSKNKYLFNLVNLKRKILGGFSRAHYSQTGEDVILAEIFSREKGGFYVDIGAYHPFHYSNTYLLHEKGWNGINIDANKKSIALFNKHRKFDPNLNMGVSLTDADLEYHIFNHQSCNTFSSEQKDKMEGTSYIKLIGTEKIHCSPLQQILEEYLPSSQEIDLLNIDVEGLDLQVLQSNNWDQFSAKVIVIEDPNFTLSNPKGSPIYNFLIEKDYSLYASTGLSLIFKKQEDHHAFLNAEF